ncbi:CaiB/BaiF CoA transferase family protein [Zwartia sp.]|uniref:CaiB/BaiF CoA transferase family protein n=1 Tax=Zwartia sp. TaxID=2978004 RepID=UPI003BB1F3FA
MTQVTLPLTGVRVLDLSYVFAVPYMAGLLSDLGAEVIKIEAPHKLDQTRGRAFGPYLDNDPAEDPWNRSGIFYVVNRGKRSLAMDLSQQEGQEIFRELVAKSDIVLENFTPRVMRKWGLHYDELKKINPSLIMLSNTGYGSTGPWSSFPSQGTTLEATMGITYYTGYRDDKPWKVGQSYPDFIACWAGLNGLWAAIAHMRKTGQGQWIDVGMYQLGASLMPEPLLQKQLDGTEPVRMGNEHAEYVPSNLYQVAGDDQWLALTIQTNQQWEALAKLMQQPHLAIDERYRTNAARRANRESINALVQDWCRSQNAKALLEKLQALGIAAGLVLNSRDLLHDPHLQHRQFYETVQHPEPIGERPIIGRPYKLRFRDAHIKKPGPRFGEDNNSILSEILGKSSSEIAALKASNVVSDLPTNPGISGTMDTASMLKLKTLIAVDQDYRS